MNYFNNIVHYLVFNFQCFISKRPDRIKFGVFSAKTFTTVTHFTDEFKTSLDLRFFQLRSNHPFSFDNGLLWYSIFSNIFKIILLKRLICKVKVK